MREGRDDESPVAPRGAIPNRVLLEDDDIPPRIAALGMESGPEAGEAATDDAQVGLGRAGEWGVRLAGWKGPEPERSWLSLSVGSAMSGARRRIRPGKRH